MACCGKVPGKKVQVALLWLKFNNKIVHIYIVDILTKPKHAVDISNILHSLKIHLAKKNSVLLSQIDLTNLTRPQAFKIQYPQVMWSREAVILLAKNTNAIECHEKVEFTRDIFPKSCFQLQKKEITEFKKIHTDSTVYVQCHMNTDTEYEIQKINEPLQIHKAMEIKGKISQELGWFVDVTNCPSIVIDKPNQNNIRNFQSLIYSKPYYELLS